MAKNQNLAKAIREAFEQDEHRRTVMDADSLWDAAERNDFHAIVLGQAHIETLLIYLIERHLRYPKSFDIARLPYNQRIRLASALGEVGEELHSLLDYMGSLRNRFAHRVNAKLVPEDMVEIRRRLPDYKGLREEFEGIVKMFEGRKFGPEGDEVVLTENQAVVRIALMQLHYILKDQLERPKPENPNDKKPDDNSLASLVDTGPQTDGPVVS